MTLERTPTPWKLAAAQSDITVFCETACRLGRFGFDTEFVMEDRYEPEVCLIQLVVAGQVLLVDPFRGLSLEPIWQLIHNADVECVVHAGQEDLALCVQHTGIVPRKVFDVQRVAGLVGLDYPLSLQRLVQSLLHVRLHKSKTLTDWRQRPLSQTQLQYAVEDVEFLLQLREKLGRRLVQKNRVAWADEENNIFEDMTFYRRVEEEKVRHLKGTRGMSGQQLAIIRDLLHWRDGLAQRLNRPARVVLKDHLLVEIARLKLTSASEIRDLRGLSLSDRSIHEVVRIVHSAMNSPSDQWPQPVPTEIETPQESALIALAMAVARSYCLENELSYSLAVTKKMIQELVRFRAQAPGQKTSNLDKHPELLCGWRGQTIGAVLDEVLSGRAAVTVASAKGGLIRVHPASR